MIGNMRTQSISAIPRPVEPVFPPVGPAPDRRRQGGRVADEGRFLGILMLQTRFPRPPGDIGNPASFRVPTRRRVIARATAPQVVRDAAGLAAGGLLDAFTAAAVEFEREGAAAITTSCGFLVLFQRELQDAVRVPLVTSSLLMLPGLLASREQVGLLTISSEALGPEYLVAAGVPRERLPDVVIQGMDPRGEFATAILQDRPRMDAAQAGREAVEAARELKRRAPGVDIVVLECTNLPPFASRIEQATGLRTLSLLQCETLLRPFDPQP